MPSEERDVSSASPASALVLPPRLDIQGARDLKGQLASLLEGSEAVLDGAGVEGADAAGLQLLVAFVRQVHASAHAVRWAAVSEELRATAALTGLTAALALPAPAGAHP